MITFDVNDGPRKRGISIQIIVLQWYKIILLITVPVMFHIITIAISTQWNIKK